MTFQPIWMSVSKLWHIRRTTAVNIPNVFGIQQISVILISVSRVSEGNETSNEEDP